MPNSLSLHLRRLPVQFSFGELAHLFSARLRSVAQFFFFDVIHTANKVAAKGRIVMPYWKNK